VGEEVRFRAAAEAPMRAIRANRSSTQFHPPQVLGSRLGDVERVTNCLYDFQTSTGVFPLQLLTSLQISEVCQRFSNMATGGAEAPSRLFHRDLAATHDNGGLHLSVGGANQAICLFA